ncbi:MAG: two-component histidine kinase MtrB [Actinomycetota bacterium]
MDRSLRRIRLRTRVTLLFVLVGLSTSVLLSTVSFLVARNYLLDRRDDVVERQAFNNAENVRSQLSSRRSEAFELINGTRTEQGGFSVLHLGSENLYYSQDLRFTQNAFPAELREDVLSGTTSYQRFTFGDDTYIGIGISIPAVDAHYFEAFPVDDEQRAITIIGSVLVAGTVIIGLIAGLVGWGVSRRLMRPLTRVALAAGDIAEGGLDTRLEPEEDPDLAILVSSFNEMADAVQTRIEREARFASDVSHELRSPITALAAAVEVLDARRADLGDRSQQALDVVVSQVRRFDQMVLDLLELSRLDVGIADLHREDIDLAAFISRIAQRYIAQDLPIVLAPGCDGMANVDKRRVERIIANLLDNARIHGGGATSVTLERAPRRGIRISIEDAGPGVAPSERARIFERFARGSAGRSRAGGTGLGLALVAEHARAHGGQAWVEDATSGGARFVVEIPGVNR